MVIEDHDNRGLIGEASGLGRLLQREVVEVRRRGHES